jgi:hypothetical protein
MIAPAASTAAGLMWLLFVGVAVGDGMLGDQSALVVKVVVAPRACH